MHFLLLDVDLFEENSFDAMVIENESKNVKIVKRFSNAAPEVWFKLPEYIKSSQSTAIFKKNLKTYIFFVAVLKL